MTTFLIIVGALVLWTLLILIFFYGEVKAIKQRDPAVKTVFSTVFLYPGLQALVSHRVANFLWRIGVPFLPRLISQVARFFTGIEIHPGAKIGRGFFIDHGMGVVIGETAIVGNGVTIFQEVTLGGTGKERGKRHPTLGDNIVVGAGAKILGNIEIGDNSYVGANAVVVKSVPPNSTVVGVPGRVTKQDGKKIDNMMDHGHIVDPIMERIEKLVSRVEELEKKC